MNFKKFISSVSALAIAGSAFAGMAVTASAEATTIFTDDCSTAANFTAGSNAVVSVVESEDSYVSIVGTGSGNRSATYSFNDEVKALDSELVTASFDFNFSDNFGVADRSVAKIEILGATGTLWSLTSTMWTGTRNDTYYVEGDDENTFTLTKGTWYTVTANLNYSANQATVALTDASGNTIVETKGLATDKLTGLNIQCPRYSTSRATYINNIAVTQDTAPAASVAYTVTAVAGNTVLETIKNDYATQNSIVTVNDIKEVIEKDGNLYRLNDSNVSNYALQIEVGTTPYTGTVAYTATTDMDYYIEGETLGTVNTQKTGYSNGAYGAVKGGITASIGTYPAGVYTLTFYLAERGDRGIYVRDVNNSDVSKNVIAYADIDKNSVNGIYTVEFTLTKETTLGITGYTTATSTTNQSSGVDYLYLKKIADLKADLSATVGNAILGEGTTTVESEKRATGFIATITNKGNTDGSVNSIDWAVTSGDNTGKFTTSITEITLEPEGEATIGLIVKGLYDANATATAVLN